MAGNGSGKPDAERRVAVAAARGAAARRRGVRVRPPARRPHPGVRARHDARAARRRAAPTGLGEDVSVVPRGRHHAARDAARRCRSRASGRWPASATTSPRSSCGRSRRSGTGRCASATGRSSRRRSTSRCARPGRSLHDVLGLEPQPVRFVNSLGLGEDAVDRAAAPAARPARPACASSSTRRRPGRRRSSTRSRRPARSTRSTSRATTASRSRTRRRSARCTTTCSPRSPDAYLEDPHDLPEVAERLGDHLERVSYDAPITRRRGHRRDAAGRARRERQAVADRQPAGAVRGLRALRAGGAADVRRRHGRARASAAGRSSCSPRCSTPTRPTTWRRAPTTRTTRPARCRPARWRRVPRRPASAGRRSRRDPSHRVGSTGD